MSFRTRALVADLLSRRHQDHIAGINDNNSSITVGGSRGHGDPYCNEPAVICIEDSSDQLPYPDEYEEEDTSTDDNYHKSITEQKLSEKSWRNFQNFFLLPHGSDDGTEQ